MLRRLPPVRIADAAAASSGVIIIFWGPRQTSVHSLITVLIHNSGHFGPLLPFWAGPLAPALPGLPMASYATGSKSTAPCTATNRVTIVNPLRAAVLGARERYSVWRICSAHFRGVISLFFVTDTQASHQTVHILFLANDRCLRDHDLVVTHCSPLF